MNSPAQSSSGSPAPQKRRSHSGFRIFGTLVLVALVAAGGWWARALQDSSQRRAEVEAALSSGAKRVEGALSKKNLEEAEHKLEELKALAVKDGRIADLESRLLAAKVAKAISDGQVEDAKGLLAKAEKDGSASIQQIKTWRDQLNTAAAQASASAASASSAASSSISAAAHHH